MTLAPYKGRCRHCGHDWGYHMMPRELAAAPNTAVPEGWQLVPKEPTEKMLEAMNGCDFTAPFDPRYCAIRSGTWQAMLAAAPKHPESEDAKENP